MEILNNCSDISEMIFMVSHPEDQEVINHPEGANKMYADGIWVKIAHWDYTDFVGYILESNQSTRTYKVQLTQNKYGHKVNIIIALSEDAIYPADIEADGFDTSFIYDLAIDWCLVNKQEDHFYQLLKENELLKEKGGNEDAKK